MEHQLIQLTDFVEINVLEEIVEHFQKATGLTTMVTDYQGRSIVQCGKFSDFCQTLRNMPSPKFQQNCRKCDAIAGVEASCLGKPMIYLCHAGIVDVALPILINGNYIGMIMIGQIVLSEEEMKSLPQRMVYPPIDFQQYPEIQEKRKEFFRSHSRITLEQLKAYSNLLFTLANYIAEIGYKKLIQQDLDAQKIHAAQEEKEKALLSKRLANYQLQSVQSQLKPAFLLKTFNSIQRQAVLEDANITSNLLLSFSSIMRRILKAKNSITTVRDELEYINHYILLRNVSSHQKIQFEADVAKELLTFSIPIFTLQPVLENLLISNLEEISDECHIYLKASRSGNKVSLNISHRELVLAPEMIADLSGISKEAEDTASIVFMNLNNVMEVLKDYYGSEFSWKYNSSPECGTSIELVIPWKIYEL